MRENDLGKETEKLKAFKAKLEEQLTASKAVVSASFDLVFFIGSFRPNVWLQVTLKTEIRKILLNIDNLYNNFL